MWGELDRKPEEIVWGVENELSTLITRMTADINNIGDFIGRILPMFVSAGIFLIVVLGVMCFINIYFEST